MERQINLDDAFDSSRVKVIETRQAQNNPNSEVTKIDVAIDDIKKPMVPITSLHPLAENYYISSLGTCKTGVLLNSYTGNSRTEAKWKGNPPSRLKNELEQVHPFHLIKAISRKNEVLFINFVGKGDDDAYNVDTNFENNILYQFALGTSFSGYDFPKNRGFKDRRQIIELPTLIQNGSVSGERNGLASEKYIIENMVNLCRVAYAETIDQIETQTQNFAKQLAAHLETYTNDNSTIQLFKPNIDENRPNKKGAITEFGQHVEKLLDGNFKSFFEKFDAHQVLLEFDDSYIAFPSNFSNDGKIEFVSNFAETLKERLPIFTTLPFSLDPDNYNFNFGNTHEQISVNQMAPLHYFQCILYSFMLKNLSQEAPKRQQILNNIFNLISEFEKPKDNFQTGVSDIGYILNYLSGGTANQSDIDFVSSMIEILYPAVSDTEHVTQFNIAKLEPNRSFNDGFLLPNHNVFVIPEQALLDLYDIQIFSETDLVPERVPLITLDQLEDLDVINLLVQRDLVKHLTEYQIYSLNNQAINEIVDHLEPTQVPFLDANNFDNSTIDSLYAHDLLERLTEDQIYSLNNNNDAMDEFISKFSSISARILNDFNLRSQSQTTDFTEVRDFLRLSIETRYGKSSDAMDKFISERVPFLNANNFRHRTINLLKNCNLIPRLIGEQIRSIYYDLIPDIIPQLTSDQVKYINTSTYPVWGNIETVVNLLKENGLIQHLTENQIKDILKLYLVSVFSSHNERKYDLLDTIMPYLTSEVVSSIAECYLGNEMLNLLAKHDLIKYLNEKQIGHICELGFIDILIPHLDTKQVSYLKLKEIWLFSSKSSEKTVELLTKHNLIPHLNEEQIESICQVGKIDAIIPQLESKQVSYITSLLDAKAIKLLAERGFIKHLTGKQISRIYETDLIETIMQQLEPEQVVPYINSILLFKKKMVNLLAERDFVQYLTKDQIQRIILSKSINTIIPKLKPKQVPYLVLECCDTETINLLAKYGFIDQLTKDQINSIQPFYVLCAIIPHLKSEQVQYLDSSHFDGNIIDLLAEYSFIDHLTKDQINSIPTYDAINAIIPHLKPEQVQYLDSSHFNENTINLIDKHGFIQCLTDNQISNCPHEDKIKSAKTKMKAIKISGAISTVLGVLTAALGLAALIFTLGISTPISIALITAGAVCAGVGGVLDYKSYKNKQVSDTTTVGKDSDFAPATEAEPENNFLTPERMEDSQTQLQNNENLSEQPPSMDRPIDPPSL